MKEINKTDFYKTIYDRECQRRFTLDNSISIPVAVTSGLIAALVFFVSNFDYHYDLVFTIIFVILSLVSTSLLVISIVNLMRSFINFGKGYEYKEIPLLSEIEKHYHELLDYNKDDINKTEIDFEKFLQTQFIKDADANTKINDNRSFKLYLAKKYLVFTLISLGTLCIPFVIISYFA